MGGLFSKTTTTTTTTTKTTTAATTTTTTVPTMTAAPVLPVPITTAAPVLPVPITSAAPVLARLNTDRQILITFSCLGLLLFIAAVAAVYFLWRSKALARKPVGRKNEVIERTETTCMEVRTCITEGIYANMPKKQRRKPAEPVTYGEVAICSETGRASRLPSETTEYACVRVTMPEKQRRKPAEPVTYGEVTFCSGTGRASRLPSETTEYACVRVTDA